MCFVATSFDGVVSHKVNVAEGCGQFPPFNGPQSWCIIYHRLTGSSIEQSGLWVAIDWEKDEEHYVAVTHST